MAGKITPITNYSRPSPEDDHLVHCVHCKGLIPTIATRCKFCGIHFRGEAGDFAPGAIRRVRLPRYIVIVVLVVILVAFILASL